MLHDMLNPSSFDVFHAICFGLMLRVLWTSKPVPR